MRRILAFLLCAALAPFARAAATPLLDGRCDEYAEFRAATHAIAPDIELRIFQNADYVWFCYTLPPDSYGMLDLRIETPALPQRLNLHASAQLGEWPADDASRIPQTPESDQWWRIDGWYANTVSFNGMRATDNGRMPRLRPSAAREVQLAKSRFGRGDWQLVFDILHVREPNGGTRSVRFPAQGTMTLAVD